MKRFIMVLAVAALMAVMLVAMAAPAFAIPGNGKDTKGKHAGYGLDPVHEHNRNGDRQHSAVAVEEGLYKGHAYGDFNN